MKIKLSIVVHDADYDDHNILRYSRTTSVPDRDCARLWDIGSQVAEMLKALDSHILGGSLDTGTVLDNEDSGRKHRDEFMRPICGVLGWPNDFLGGASDVE